ncbi:MAG TPA: pentapeptide repeat-containing protein [Pseudonocardiaceae bacterium]|nr:pentapeptide repeat-containing protein [Pseudonocardiaceae bacterium]
MKDAPKPSTADSATVDVVSDAGRLRRALDAPDRVVASAGVSEWTANALERSGRGIDLSSADLARADLAGLDLRGVMLNRAVLHSTRLDNANLTGANLTCPGMEKTSLRGATLRGTYLHALAAQVCDFTSADLSHVLDATGTMFHGCRFVDAVLAQSSFAGATFYQCDLRGTNWRATALQGATFNECLLDGAVFDYADLEQVTMSKCHLDTLSFEGATGRGLTIQRPTAASAVRLDGAQLPGLRLAGVRGDKWTARNAHLRDIDVVDCQLMNAKFANADLSGGRLVRCELSGIDLSEASLVGAALAYTSAAGAILRQAFAENLAIHECSLPRVSFEGIKARGLVVRDCDLSGAKMTGAYLYRAMFTGDPPRAMSLRGADFSGANLVQAHIAADLTEACLVGAHASYARLNQSTLCDTDLRGISLFDASMVKTDFTGAQLSVLRPPFFADRCTGLAEALTAAGDARALGYTEELAKTLCHGTSTSTLA